MKRAVKKEKSNLRYFARVTNVGPFQSSDDPAEL